MEAKNLQSVVWKEGEYYIAQSLNVDVSSFGDSKDEALGNLKEALELYFEDADDTSFAEVENPEIVTTNK